MDLAVFKRLYGERYEATRFLVDQTNKSSVLVIQQFPEALENEILLPAVRESVSNIIAFAELGDLETLEYLISQADGAFDAIAMDSDDKNERSGQLIDFVKASVQKSKLFHYSDNSTWAESATNFIQHIEGGLKGKAILVTGKGILARKLVDNLFDFGATLFELRDSQASPDPQLIKTPPRVASASPGVAEDAHDFGAVDLLIGASIKQNSVSRAIAEKLRCGINVYDMGIGNFPADFISVAREKQNKIYRLDNRAGISSMVLSLFETDYLIRKVMGLITIKGVELVSGGVMGKEGAIIVDNVYKPTHIIGIADGKGRVKFFPESDKENSDHLFVERLIAPI